MILASDLSNWQSPAVRAGRVIFRRRSGRRQTTFARVLVVAFRVQEESHLHSG